VKNLITDWLRHLDQGYYLIGNLIWGSLHKHKLIYNYIEQNSSSIIVHVPLSQLLRLIVVQEPSHSIPTLLEFPLFRNFLIHFHYHNKPLFTTLFSTSLANVFNKRFSLSALRFSVSNSIFSGSSPNCSLTNSRRLASIWLDNFFFEFGFDLSNLYCKLLVRLLQGSGSPLFP